MKYGESTIRTNYNEYIRIVESLNIPKIPYAEFKKQIESGERTPFFVGSR